MSGHQGRTGFSRKRRGRGVCCPSTRVVATHHTVCTREAGLFNLGVEPLIRCTFSCTCWGGRGEIIAGGLLLDKGSITGVVFEISLNRVLYLNILHLFIAISAWIIALFFWCHLRFQLIFYLEI